MTDFIGRREFITALGGVVAAWPLAARAQQTDRVRRVGVLVGLAESDPETHSWLGAFRDGLDRLGWPEGRNLRIDYRYAPGNRADQAQVLAKELVALGPDVILATGTSNVAAFQREAAQFRLYS